jgi:hypothetical protein
VVKDSLTHRAGLCNKDFLISIAGQEVHEMSHEQVGRVHLDNVGAIQAV